MYRQIQGDGQVFSTDDFFYKSGSDVYDYTPEKLSDAHAWNRKRGLLVKPNAALYFKSMGETLSHFTEIASLSKFLIHQSQFLC